MNVPEFRQGLFAVRLLSDGSIELTRRGLLGRSRYARSVLHHRSQVETAHAIASLRKGGEQADYAAVLRWALERIPKDRA